MPIESSLTALLSATMTTAIFVVGCTCNASANHPAGQPVRSVTSQEMAELERQLDSSSLLVRRRAARKLAARGIETRLLMEKAFRNSDFLVQRTVLRALCRLPGIDPVSYLKTAVENSHHLVRLAAVEELAQIQPRTSEVTSLLTKARTDESQAVSIAANKALWPFHKTNVSIRDRLDYHYDVQIASTIRVQKTGWKFHLDPQRDGHLKKWYARSFDDSTWKTIQIEGARQKFGYDYIGVAWYRGWIALPSKPEHVAAELHFRGVDEHAWVWINGEYIGQHAIGPIGWDQPFRLDVTKELRWGQTNQITVRAMNTANAGGIWRPVEIEVLK